MANKFVKAQNDPTVYLREGGGQLRALNAAEYAAQGGDPSQVDTVASLSDEDRSAASAAAAAQVDPGTTAQRTDLQNEQTVAQQSAQRLQDAVSEIYRQKRENDPLARQGIASGAAQDYATGQQVKDTKSIGEDLGTKLSYIASKLTNLNAGATQQKNSLADTLTSQYANYRTGVADKTYDRNQQEQAVAYQKEQDAYSRDQNDKATQRSAAQLLTLQGIGGLPDSILTQLLKSYGYDVTP